MVDLTTEIASIKLNNPTILASGIMDEDAGSMRRVFNSGASCIVTKSIGLEPNDGYKNPTFLEIEHGILNAMGLPNPGINDFHDEIKKLKKLKIPVIGSIFGSDYHEFIELSNKMSEYSVDAIELNMSCPHAKGYGLEIGSDSKLVNKITSKVKKSSDLPVFVKISSNLTDIVKIANSIKNGNADGIVAINSVKAMKINLELKKPVLSNKIGCYSGKAIKPIGVRCVYELYKNVDIPIIGVGGITTGEDVLEYIMAGASAVQIGAGVYYRGIDVFKKVCEEIELWMKENNYNKLYDLIGAVHK